MAEKLKNKARANFHGIPSIVQFRGCPPHPLTRFVSHSGYGFLDPEASTPYSHIGGSDVGRERAIGYLELRT